MKIGKFEALALISDKEPLLKAVHIPTHSEFIVLDEIGFCVNGFSGEKLLAFINGDENIISSSGREFVYANEKNKASIEEVEEFIKLLKNE